jgi:hypothetical protein
MASNYRETAVKTVEVEKKRLADALSKNLETHKSEYVEARAGYEKARIQAYRELAEAAALAAEEDSGKTRKKAEKAWNKLRNLDVPQDHAESYEQAIALMEWETRDVVELSINDFECYVRDNWDWQHSFKASVANYSR